MATIAQAIEQFTDWRWRLNNLYWITDEKGQRIPFRMNWAQESLFDEMDYLNVILKARQLGFTTFIQLYMLDQCVFYPTINAGTIAHTREDAEAFFTQKVRYPYDSLPEGIKSRNPAVLDSARHLSFKNQSSLRVGTSLRSGTFQFLHVSEFGKICAKYPDKAKEIKTGAFNTVHAGQVIWVESTAEGQEGEFFDMCERAQALQRRGTKLTPLDFKFHFYPWWKHPGYVLDPEGVVLTTEDLEYFAKLEIEEGIHLSPEQKAWYAKKKEQQQDDMKREFPSTPKEAFEASVEGAYYQKEMNKVEEEGRVCPLAIENVGTETWWDLGMNDLMSICWVQRVGPWLHFIDYYDNSGEGLGHYASILQEKQREHNLVYTSHLWPHDGNVRILDEIGRPRTEVMAGLGYEVKIIERSPTLAPGIQAVRDILPKSRFDNQRCEKLVRALKSYRKDWDDIRGRWKDHPFKNWATHPADAVRTGAMYEVFEGDYEHWNDDMLDDGRSAVTGY